MISCSSVQTQYLEWAALTGGLQLARKVQEYVSSLDQPSESFLRRCIFLELAQVGQGLVIGLLCPTNVRSLAFGGYESYASSV